ncbi:hypothetical protein ACJZ2D_000871 [Fusarium nematophilum]
MQSSPPTFPYEPLVDGSIRLVSIKPGPWDPDVECELHVEKLEEQGQEGHVRNRRIGPGQVATVAVAKQVPNMHQIYSTAKEVLLWLGTMPIPPDFLKPWIDNEKYSWIRFDQEDCSMGQELREDALERYALFLRSSQFPIQALSRQPSGSPRKQQLMHFATASEMFTFRHHLWLDDMQPREGDRIVKPNGREKGAFFMRPRRDGTFQLLGRLAASGTSLLAPGKRIEVTLI